LPLKFEAGTANFIGAVGLAEAIKFLQSFSAEDIERHEKELLDYATAELQKIEGLRIYGTTESKSPIISFNVEGCDHYDIGMILDKMGVAVRTGHHCAEPVMARYGTNGVVRASIALYTNKTDIDNLVAAVKRAVAMLK
jgi:cysteine desulfurase/selenocysteine lyase